MNKKGGFAPDKFVIALIIISLFTSAWVLILNNTIDNYSKVDEINFTTGKFSNVYNISEDMYNQSREVQDKVLGADIEGEDESWESMTKGSYSGLRLVRDSFSIFGNIINSIATEIGVPDIFIVSAMTIISISVIFAIIYIIFRFNNR